MGSGKISFLWVIEVCKAKENEENFSLSIFEAGSIFIIKVTLGWQVKLILEQGRITLKSLTFKRLSVKG